MSAALLAGLNEAQRDAVSSKAQQLAILAGPGSGKTHTLTSRVAYLMQGGLRPENIIVSTFTKKAANEMKERIAKLLGDDRASKLTLGTFHSICFKYLCTYGKYIGIRKGFSIADSSDSLSIIKRIIQRKNLGLDPNATRGRISTRKAKGEWGDKLVKAMKWDHCQPEMEICYNEYQDALDLDNLLDYDDLLVKCVQLFREHPDCVSNIEAVLIDEFQDTNVVQFDLMRLMAQHKKRVTIVGDPDQSIYGFRAAEVRNYKSLLQQYPDTVTISLEENYRSSGQILQSAMAIIEQDQSRIKKTLRPTHVAGTKPVLRTLANAIDEGEWTAMEIKRTLALTANLLTYNDFAVLVRSAFLGMRIETAFGQAGIPYRTSGGRTFFDRIEIKIILQYMRVVNNPGNNEAFIAVVNEPKRKVGDASIDKLLQEASRRRVSIWDMVTKGPMDAQIPTVAMNGIKKFMDIIKEARKVVEDSEQSSVVALIQYLITAIGLEEYLKSVQAKEAAKETNSSDEKESQKFQTSMENIREFLTIAAEADETNGLNDLVEPLADVGMQQDELSTLLSNFLVNISLATDKRAKDEEGREMPRVVISTMHSAKGLEWPVVFLPGCFQGGNPNSRGMEDNMDEERRIFYVAMTRAKALLNLTYPKMRKSYDKGDEVLQLSSFLEHKQTLRYFGKKGPSFRDDVVQNIAKILRKPVPANFAPADDIALLSFEDDQFPENGEKKAPSKWGSNDNFEGKGHRLGCFERPVLVDRKDDNSSSRYKTTMEKLGGFVSAKTVPAEQSENALRGRPSKRKPEVIDGDEDELPALPALKKTKSMKNGQQGIASFFAPLADSKAAPKGKAPGNRDLRGDYAAEGPAAVTLPEVRMPYQTLTPVVAAATYNRPSIDPNLCQHKIGGLGLPPKRHIRPQTPTEVAKPYGHVFSSSPQKPEDDDIPAVDLTGSPVEPQVPVSNQWNGRKTASYPRAPVKTSTSSSSNSSAGSASSTGYKGYRTTMDNMAPNVGDRRTLGVKPSMNGWANRMKREKASGESASAARAQDDLNSTWCSTCGGKRCSKTYNCSENRKIDPERE